MGILPAGVKSPVGYISLPLWRTPITFLGGFHLEFVSDYALYLKQHPASK